ncbi:MAG: hypothetical protein ACFNYD_00535 [Bacteroides sp.]
MGQLYTAGLQRDFCKTGRTPASLGIAPTLFIGSNPINWWHCLHLGEQGIMAQPHSG